MEPRPLGYEVRISHTRRRRNRLIWLAVIVVCVPSLIVGLRALTVWADHALTRMFIEGERQAYEREQKNLANQMAATRPAGSSSP